MYLQKDFQHLYNLDWNDFVNPLTNIIQQPYAYNYCRQKHMDNRSTYHQFPRQKDRC